MEMPPVWSLTLFLEAHPSPSQRFSCSSHVWDSTLVHLWHQKHKLGKLVHIAAVFFLSLDPFLWLQYRCVITISSTWNQEWGPKVKRTSLLAYLEERTTVKTVKNRRHYQLWQNFSVNGSSSILLYGVPITEEINYSNLILDRHTVLWFEIWLNFSKVLSITQKWNCSHSFQPAKRQKDIMSDKYLDSGKKSKSLEQQTWVGQYQVRRQLSKP